MYYYPLYLHCVNLLSFRFYNTPENIGPLIYGLFRDGVIADIKALNPKL